VSRRYLNPSAALILALAFQFLVDRYPAVSLMFEYAK